MKIVYINPWGESGHNLAIKVNGHTGLLHAMGGGDFLAYNELKGLDNWSILNNYDYVLVPFWGGFYELMARIKKTTTAKIIGVGDIELQAIPYAPRTELKKFYEAAHLCDIFITSNPDTVSLIRSIRDNKQTNGIAGWCIYPEYHKQYQILPINKSPLHISIGCSNSGYNRNILENFLVFKHLLKKHPALIGHYWNVLSKHDNEIIDLINTVGIPMKNMVLRREYPYQGFLAEFSKMYISIHVYTFHVVSRLSQDAMALGIPHVGCNANYSDRVYCPASVNEYDVEAAIKNADRLLVDSNYYNQARSQQFRGVSNYSSEVIGKQIMEAIEQYEAGHGSGN